MRLVAVFMLVVLTTGLPLAAFADSTTVFANHNGTFTQNMTDLTLTGSKLLSVSGLGAYNCSGVSICSGSLTLTTGPGNVGSGTVGTSATFTPGGVAMPPPGSTFGNITITGNPGGPGGAFSFTGPFSSASWVDVAGTRQFYGLINNGTLSEGG